ncbi:hypothetical protein CPLU01_07524 [Colletotrichum plurivorum]|uniref:Uncharacterized protein n=1 Tax=Colletotrichum plurivorum TaxID=2175906 RepID=A0A8H6KEF5_9PEZI|nr:hypothetical protein CPLU01_07524 [Colletotrichum plurivorum]
MPWTRGGSEHALGEIPWRDISGSPSAIVGGSFVPEIRDGYTELTISQTPMVFGSRVCPQYDVAWSLISSTPTRPRLDDQG